MPEEKDGCVKPAKGPIVDAEIERVAAPQGLAPAAQIPVARVGGSAPDFEAAAHVDGGFKNIRLSDYKGQWIVLCFYPGDFTFV